MQTDKLYRVGVLPISPTAWSSSHADAAFSEEGDSPRVGAAHERVRVAIVEDDYLVASEVESALTQAGFEVVAIAGSAEEILEIAGTVHPTLAVMDIRLSGKRDGIDAALELFARHRIRCVFATAHQTVETRARAEPAKPLAWVPKPYLMSVLVHAVRCAVKDLDDR